LLLLALCLVAPSTLANQVIPAGGRIVLSDGLFDLSCTDVAVGGLVDMGTGRYVNVRNVLVGPLGVIQRSGTIGYSGTLTIQGTIQPSVQMVVNPQTDLACPGPPVIVTLEVKPTPALGNSMLVALAVLLLLLALLALRGQATPRPSSAAIGAHK
jgi:hypothetical protein